MPRVLCFAALLLGSLFAFNPSGATAQSGGGKGHVIVFRKPLDNGREIVVLRGPCRPAADAQAIVSWKAPPGGGVLVPKGLFVVTVELRGPNSAPLTIGTRVVFDHARGRIREASFDVFDVLSLRDQAQIVLAITENGHIMLWQISPTGVSRMAVLRGGDWSLYAALHPIDRTKVSVKLGLTEDGLVKVEVEDLRDHGLKLKWPTRFLQLGKETWQFKRDEATPPQVERIKGGSDPRLLPRP